MPASPFAPDVHGPARLADRPSPQVGPRVEPVVRREPAAGIAAGCGRPPPNAAPAVTAASDLRRT
ncbi:hypothetical protein ACWEHL_30365, partial [Streptomyces sp. NPDC004726]